MMAPGKYSFEGVEMGPGPHQFSIDEDGFIRIYKDDVLLQTVPYKYEPLDAARDERKEP